MEPLECSFLSSRSPCSDRAVWFPISPLIALQLCSYQQKRFRLVPRLGKGGCMTSTSDPIAALTHLLLICKFPRDMQSTGTTRFMGTSMLMSLKSVCLWSNRQQHTKL